MRLEEGRKYVKHEDVSKGDAKSILDYLNAAKTAKEIAEVIESPDKKGTGAKIAQRILDERDKLGGFQDLKQVASVFQVEPDSFAGIARNLWNMFVPSSPYIEIESVELPDESFGRFLSELIPGLSAVFGSGSFMPPLEARCQAAKDLRGLIETVAEWNIEAAQIISYPGDPLGALEDTIAGLENDDITQFAESSAHFRLSTAFLDPAVLPNLTSVTQQFTAINSTLAFQVAFLPFCPMIDFTKILPNQITKDPTCKKLLEDIKKLIEKISKDNKIDQNDKDNLEELKKKLEALLKKIEALLEKTEELLEEAEDEKTKKKHQKEVKKKKETIDILERIIRAVGELINNGLTDGALDDPDIKEITWTFNKTKKCWIIKIKLNETFSLTLISALISLDAKKDCTITIKQLLNGDTEITVDPPKSILFNVSFLVPNLPDFYITKLVYSKKTGKVTVEGHNEDTGKDGKLEIDTENGQVNEYEKQKNGTYTKTKSYKLPGRK